MYYAEIVRAVDRLKRRYHETDPFKLCVAMGIILIPQSLGTAQDAIKGFYLESKRIRTITVNSDTFSVVGTSVVGIFVASGEVVEEMVVSI